MSDDAETRADRLARSTEGHVYVTLMHSVALLRTVEVAPGVFVDLNQRGEVHGVEVLDAQSIEVDGEQRWPYAIDYAALADCMLAPIKDGESR